ncbi:MAG: ABC transporter permease [Desulfitobacteriia bacterium]
MRILLNKFLKYYPAFLFLIFVVALWQFCVQKLNLPPWLLPSPTQVGEALWSTKDLLWGHARITILETTLGFFLAIILGLLTGALMTVFPILKRTFYPFLIISQTVPLIAIAPLLLLWLGYGLLPKIIIVILVCFFPLTISLIQGLEATNQDLLNLLKSMGATKWQILLKVRWPNALPSLFAGLKIAATYSVMAAIIGEWLGASHGLGIYLTRSSNNFLTDRVFAAIIAITILSFFYYGVILFITKFFLPRYSRSVEHNND